MSYLRYLSIIVIVTSCISTAMADPLVVYSARKEHLIKPLFDAYTDKTGVEIEYITDKAGPLFARLKAEGANTPADMLITVDAGNLWKAAQEGVLYPYDSAALKQRVPEHLRDKDGRWYALSIRARTLVYSTERVDPSSLSSYEDLADPEWKGRLCLRTSKKIYNQSLVAMMIASLGEQQAEQVVAGWVGNLAEQPFSNDTKTLQAIIHGRCDVAIVNTYYFGRLLKKTPDAPLALFWPNQQDRGVHINVSGAGITAHSKHKEAAGQLLTWMSGPEAQSLLAGLNMEYPINTDIKPDPLVQTWGDFKADVADIKQAGELQSKAVMLMDKVGYR